MLNLEVNADWVEAIPAVETRDSSPSFNPGQFSTAEQTRTHYKLETVTLFLHERFETWLNVKNQMNSFTNQLTFFSRFTWRDNEHAAYSVFKILHPS